MPRTQCKSRLPICKQRSNAKLNCKLDMVVQIIGSKFEFKVQIQCTHLKCIPNVLIGTAHWKCNILIQNYKYKIQKCDVQNGNHVLPIWKQRSNANLNCKLTLKY